MRACGRIRSLAAVASAQWAAKVPAGEVLGRRFLGATTEGVGVPTISTELPGEKEKFSKLADRWWDRWGPFRALHTMNEVRCSFIRDAILAARTEQGQVGSGKEPLLGVRLLDVGCGGGLLAEPLARLGATVLGVDMVEESVRVAADHAARDPALAGRLSYRVARVEDLAAEEAGAFDAVVASEVVEHVRDPAAFMGHLARACAPGGTVTISTINRTAASWGAAIVVAEGVLGLVPPGTHRWEAFIRPEELVLMAEAAGLEARTATGLAFNPLTQRWAPTDDMSISYMLGFGKGQGG